MEREIQHRPVAGLFLHRDHDLLSGGQASLIALAPYLCFRANGCRIEVDLDEALKKQNKTIIFLQESGGPKQTTVVID